MPGSPQCRAERPPPPSRTDLLQYALIFRSWGWSVLALRRKRPAVRAWMWLQRRRPTDRDVARMFGPAHGARVDGLGVVTGAVSGGLCVRDFDDPAGYRAWAAAHPALARRLPTARTRRGVHVYFRLPPGHPPVYRRWTDGRHKGELLGDGKHYVAVPPSAHPKGGYYEWLREPVASTDLPVLTPAQAGMLSGQPPDPAAKPPRTPTTSSVTPFPRSAPAVPLEIAEREAIARCLPTGPGQRSDCLFRLARTLKALPHMADAEAKDLFPVIETWFDLARPVIRTQSLATCWRDFRSQWAVVTSPMGRGFEAAVAEALAAPPPPEAKRFADAPTRRLVAVCVTLQRYAGAEPFFLSCRTAQRVAGFTNHMTGWRRLGALADAGLLVVVERGTGGTSRRRASRYRWAGARH